MHIGFVLIDNEKMSKSLGNFFTVREIFKKYHPDEVRYFLLGAHYRQPINYSEAELEAARAALTGYYSALARVDLQAEDSPVVDEVYAQRFADSMNDDFNTPGAMAVLADLKRELNRSLKDDDQGRANSLGRELARLGGIIGILGHEPQAWLQRSAPDAAAGEELGDQEIESLIAKRKQARDEKDWAESDRIRDLLTAAGVQLEDGPDGTTWKR